mmetsp:Transcript_100260/g.269271  ORF Transcript_100260/g.269271 Transcript_100260/m.269271 type:complete len:322 (-) Transcript_100260:223-1188(-)
MPNSAFFSQSFQRGSCCWSTGPPTEPNMMASDLAHISTVEAGKCVGVSPAASVAAQAAPPTGASVKEKVWPYKVATLVNTFKASTMTSGPMPSPDSTAMFLLTPISLRRLGELAAGAEEQHAPRSSMHGNWTEMAALSQNGYGHLEESKHAAPPSNKAGRRDVALLLLMLLLCHLPPLQPPVVKRPDRQRAPSSPTQWQKQQHCQFSGRPPGTGASCPLPPPQSPVRGRPCAVPTQARKTAQCLTRMPRPWKRSQPRLQLSQLPDLVARVLMQRRAEHQRAGARRGRRRRHRSEKRCGGRLFGALLKPAGCPGVDETDFPT